MWILELNTNYLFISILHSQLICSIKHINARYMQFICQQICPSKHNFFLIILIPKKIKVFITMRSYQSRNWEHLCASFLSEWLLHKRCTDQSPYFNKKYEKNSLLILGWTLFLIKSLGNNIWLTKILPLKYPSNMPFSDT